MINRALNNTPGPSAGEIVVVAMSGGVDSSAAALLLAEEGHRVAGISMQVWDYRKNNGNSKRATCCAPADFDDAREVARAGEFPFYVFDFEDSFEDEVIKPFVASYVSGMTPNPCVECNRKVKFRELRRRARALGANLVATGHYAQVKRKKDGARGLFTGKDLAKDQSYFLYSITPEELECTLFPVGHLQKTEVRKILESRGIRIASKPESQDICFISGKVSEFIEARAVRRPGEIRSAAGEKLGEHEGVHNFTVGQRKGLRLAAPNPLYVLGIDAKSAAVSVGERSELERESFSVFDVNWIVPPVYPLTALVKLRYRHPGVLCRIEETEAGQVTVRFLEEWTAVSPGQSAVFYRAEPDVDGDTEVLGGGIIGK